MNAKMKYWTSVIKNIIFFLLTLVFIFLLFKLALFYIPFFIGLIISLLIEPLIQKLANRTNLTRKTCAIIVLLVIFTIIICSISFGVVTLITESSDLLFSLNTYIEKIYTLVQRVILNIKINEINLPQSILDMLESTTTQILNTTTKYVTLFLSNTIQKVTMIPIAFIYVVITIISTYFICADKYFILDQLEHHVPRLWVKRFGNHLKEICSILGNYLKAEAILIFISFTIILTGLVIGKVVGLNIEYPLLCALGIAFVDALPILRIRNCYYSLGYIFLARQKSITFFSFNWIIYSYNNCKANTRTKTCK